MKKKGEIDEERTSFSGSFHTCFLAAILKNAAVITKPCPTLCDPMDCSTQTSLPSPTPRVYSNSCLLSWWSHPTISSTIAPFSCPQSFPASRSFPASWLLASGGQRTGASASASALPMNIQDKFPLGLIGLIPLQSGGLSRVFSSTTVKKHQFFGAQSSLWSTTHIRTWLLENHSFD